MNLLDSLYGSDGASLSEVDALRLFRYRLGDLLREIYWGPLCSPEQSSLSLAIKNHSYRLESAIGFSGLLAKCFPAIHSELGWDRHPPSGSITRSEALRVVVLGYSALQPRLKDLRIAGIPKKPEPRSGAEWLRENRNSPGFWAVENMAARIQQHLGKWFSGFLIHGSVASGDAVHGFSDFDTMVVLSNNALRSEKELDGALRFLASTHVCLLQFSPYMHHSHMLAGEMEFEAMSLAMTPPCLFRNGVYWGDWPADAGTAQSDLDCLLAFRAFDWFFEEWLQGRSELSDAYEVIWWAGNTIIIPVLYAQLRDGIDRWKSAAINAARSDLSPAQTEMIDYLTGLRTQLSNIPVLDRDWWEEFPSDTHPGLAVEWARRATSTIDWTAHGVTLARLAQSTEFFRDIRQLGLQCWQRQSIRKPPIWSAWLGLHSPIIMNEKPIPATSVQYDSVRSEFLSKAQDVKGVLAVFEFGQVGCPGLSDLDFLVVVDRQHRKQTSLPVGLLSGRSAEIMGHSPFVIGVEALNLLPVVFPIFRLERIFGRIKCPQATTMAEDNIIPLILSMLLTKYPLDLLALWNEPALRLRTLAAFVHSFVHLKHMLSCVSDSALDTVDKLVALDSQIRSEWTNARKLDWRKTVDGLDLMFQATADMLALLDRRFEQLAGCKVGKDNASGTGIWLPTRSFPIKFVADWSKSMMLSSIEDAKSTGPFQPIMFPSSIGRYLAWVAAGEGPASKELQKQISFTIPPADVLFFDRFSSYRKGLNMFVAVEKAGGRSISKYIGLTTFDGEPTDAGIPPPSSSGHELERLEHLIAIRNALSGYHRDHGAYPKSSGGWDGLYTDWGKSGAGWIPGLVPGYLNELPRDPRCTNLPKQQYLYMSNGQDYKLISHLPEDLELVRYIHPELTDPKRNGWAYGFWTEGAVDW